MKIFTASQIKACDEFTIKNEPISSVFLMERAAEKCVDYLAKKIDYHQKIYLFCGNGNNGGDGFAIARLLYYLCYDVTVFIDQSNQGFSNDAAENFNRLKEISGVAIKDFSEVSTVLFEPDSVIIDALFGSGLNRNIEGKLATLIHQLNQIEACKISIDIPSGIFADKIIDKDSTVFKAKETLSFQFYKKAFLHPEVGVFCGEIHLLDIGLHPDFTENTLVKDFTIDEEIIKTIYRPREEFSHKGNFGKSYIIAGSYGKIGAAVLATKAALKSGSGLTFCVSADCGYSVLQTHCVEAMFMSFGNHFCEKIEINDDATFGIGPGFGTEEISEKALINFLKSKKLPLVLDADAFNLLSKNTENLKFIPENSIITPHPKEFARLFGVTSNSFERLELAKIKSKELNIYIVLKDHHTQIVTPNGDVFYNITGNSGLAKGGSGDVLLGIITSLLAQNYTPKEAAIFGVWLHGSAADFAAKKYSKEAMQPTDVIESLSEVFKSLS